MSNEVDFDRTLSSDEGSVFIDEAGSLPGY